MARGRITSSQAAVAKPVSAADFLPLLYGELRAIAAKRLRAERRNHTLQPTALVHEVFLKLRDRPGFQDEQHFLATAARAMRQILVDHARARLAAKRSGRRVSLSEASMVFIDERIEDVLEIDRVLTKLAERDAPCRGNRPDALLRRSEGSRDRFPAWLFGTVGLERVGVRSRLAGKRARLLIASHALTANSSGLGFQAARARH